MKYLLFVFALVIAGPSFAGKEKKAERKIASSGRQLAPGGPLGRFGISADSLENVPSIKSYGASLEECSKHQDAVKRGLTVAGAGGNMLLIVPCERLGGDSDDSSSINGVIYFR